jgi:hypothetical protein
VVRYAAEGLYDLTRAHRGEAQKNRADRVAIDAACEEQNPEGLLP